MSEFRRIWPPDGKNQFDGGLNSKYQKTLIQDNESPDNLNIIAGDLAAGTRHGYVKVNTASVGTFVCDGLYTRRGSNNAETMIAFYGGNGYTLNSTSLVTIPSAQSVFTIANRVGSSQMEDHIFFGNGGVTPYKYNGTDFTRHGIEVASNVISVNSNGAGALSGAYAYKVTYRNSALVEGNPSDASTTFVVTAKVIRVTSLPVAPQSYGVGARVLYRTVDSGTTFFRVAVIADNTTTTYDDNIADSSLGAQAPSNNGKPPTYSTIIFHKRRLFMNDVNNPQFVWYTDLDNPYVVGSTSFETFGDSSTDFVKSFGIQDDNLVVFCEQKAYPWFMASESSPSGWRKLVAKSAYSSKSPFGNFSFDNKVGFPAVQNHKFAGIGALLGDQLDPDASFLSVAVAAGELKSNPIEPDMFDVQESYLGNISSIVWKNTAYITLTKGSNQTTNNRVYVMDFDLDNISKKQKITWQRWSGINAAQFTVYNGNLYFGSSTANGYLYRFDESVYSDDGAAINSYMWTKEFSGNDGEESFSKDFRYFNFLVDAPGQYFMDVAIRTDSDAGMGTNYQVDLSPNEAQWGTMVWGTDVWGGGVFQLDKKVFIPETRGKRIQFKFSNQNVAGQRFKVHWLNFSYNLKGPR